MAVLLDTTRMTALQRCQAMSVFLEGVSTPMKFDLSRPVADMQTWTASWSLGGLKVLQAQGSAIRGVRGAHEVDATPDAHLVIAYAAHGVTTFTRREDEFRCHPGALLLYDTTEPHSQAQPDGHNIFGFMIDQRDLGLPSKVIRRAVRNPQASPIYELLLRHIVRCCAALPSLEDTPAAQALREVTVDLTRTLVATAGGTAPEAVDTLHSSIPMRVEQYVLEHLGDPSLSATQVAAAHYISVRQLYYLWSAHSDQGLAEWVMSQRLERASRQLAVGREAITSVAHRYGFADATHFSRRFRERYGATPREWRALWRELPGPSID
ncbi:helix-turn-helix domain-containing protein [Blastococcus sp. CT_GayMR20]|uniref:helix-turn-helix domain-containing protein n=1 Tax=Blastococcus sp. CT_GayMR20 TaxID=2559609 RepID=UPI001431D573|nr:helix-turn-helix domain-containing protein [Blastococcus sp. CT_GayMR20]